MQSESGKRGGVLHRGGLLDGEWRTADAGSGRWWQQQNEMKVSKFIWFAISGMLAAAASGADETLIVKDLLGPKAHCASTATFITLVGSPTRCRDGTARRRRY